MDGFFSVIISSTFSSFFFDFLKEIIEDLKIIIQSPLVSQNS